MVHNIKLQKSISGRVCEMHGKVHFWVVRSTFCDQSIELNTRMAIMICTDPSYHISTTLPS
jgi:hypothetical protein